MQTKTVISRTAIVVGLIWSALLAALGLQLPSFAAKALGFVPLALVLLFTFFDKFIWHWSPVIRFVGRPDLRGTWIGTFDAEWIAEDNSRNRTSGSMALVIKQTYTTLSIALLAEKSKSYSFLAEIRTLESGDHRADYDYTNKPFLHQRRMMPEHSGSAQLLVTGPRTSALEGEYWTSRLSRGTLTASWRSSRYGSDLPTCQALQQETRKEIV